MNTTRALSLCFSTVCCLAAACTDDSTGTTSGTETETGDGDGDGDPSGDGDGDGDPSGDGDGDPSGDGDGDPSGDGDGDGDAVCGNGMVEAGEACDDGNAVNTDGCLDTCVAASCGDGFVWADNEACDDGNDVDTDDCLATCVAATCGDGVVWEGNEACDDGNEDDSDECVGECVLAECGDGLLWAGTETCDDGNADADDGCSDTCETELYSVCDGVGIDSCSPIRILYAVASNDTPAFRADIAALTGGTVDYVNASIATPTLAELEASYDCVFTHPNSSYNNGMAFGTALRDFVDGGGNVVLGIATGFAPPTGLAGSPIMATDYSPVSTAGSVNFAAHTYAGDGVSILHDGVAAYGLNLIDNGVVLQGEGISDGTYANGTIATAYRPDFKVVYVNGTGSSEFGANGDWARLIANACGAGFVAP